MTRDERFPAAVYAETVLEVHFREAQHHFLDFLLEINYAHILMLARQQIIPREVARRCIMALDELNREEIAGAAWDRHSEDLFFHVELCLEQMMASKTQGTCTPRAAGMTWRLLNTECVCGLKFSK